MTRNTWNAVKTALLKMREDATDKTASETAELYETLKQDGQEVEAGTRINWHGRIKKATITLWDRIENDPNHAPNLWEDIPYRDGIRIIPEVITTASAFSDGERGWWGDVIYICKMDNCVWTPEQYPQAWNAEVAE